MTGNIINCNKLFNFSTFLHIALKQDKNSFTNFTANADILTDKYEFREYKKKMYNS